jgi:UDP-N-acetylmuramoyl-tripeptide--D-alanyl-D-alanine ligase
MAISIKSVLKNIISFLLRWEADLILRKYKPKVVGVTGSVGKTSAKDAIYAVLATEFSVRKSEKSFNSEIGIPLTIIGCQNAWNNPVGWMKNLWQGAELILFRKDNFPKWLVLEVGADRPGDIQSVSKWLRPDVAVLTKFAKTPVHIEYFKNREEVIKEKGYLAMAIKPGGTLIVNGDDEDAMSFVGKIKEKTLIYGVEHKDCDVRASYPDLYYDNEVVNGIQFKADFGGNSVPVKITGVIGEQAVFASLAGIAVGLSQGLNLVKISESLSNVVLPKGRMNLIPGLKNTLIIDDTYNASPVAVHSALRGLRDMKCSGRKIVALGDMMELGKHSVGEHKEVGESIQAAADVLVAVGLRMRGAAESALRKGMDEKNIFQFDDSVAAGEFLQNFIQNGDVILVKGSQSTRMEKIVVEIMAEPTKAKDLVVRQEVEWLAK